MPKTASRGPGRPPAAKSAETRGRILCAAREVFSEVGYDAATFQEIAARADLTRPAINHYFASKRALYLHVVEQINAVVIAGRLQVAEREQSFTGRIRAFLETAVSVPTDYDRASAAFLVTSVLESQRHPELRQHDNDPLAQTRQFAATAVQDGIASGELRSDLDVDSVVETLVSAFWGLGFYAGFIGDQQRLVSVAGEFMGLFGHGSWLANEYPGSS